MSCLSFSMVKSLSWSSLESVFFTRRAVRRAGAFWNQHSFMIFTMADRIWIHRNKCNIPPVQHSLCFLMCLLNQCHYVHCMCMKFTLCQHMFEISVGIWEFVGAEVKLSALVCMCIYLCLSSDGLPDGNEACCANWASAGPHIPPSSSPQSWDLRAPGQRREDGTLQQSLKQRKREFTAVLFLQLTRKIIA